MGATEGHSNGRRGRLDGRKPDDARYVDARALVVARGLTAATL